MAKEDENKTAFHAPKGVYCYKKITFGLKNARATYQRLLDKVFKSQNGRNMEVYVDDMVIKIRDKEDMLADIQGTFERLQRINMNLNPKKCSFGMEEGQFLGHIVSKQGFKANPTKVQASTSLKRPKTIKKVQSLNGKLAAFNRFLAKSAEKSLPFFETLKGCLEKKDFMWTKEADRTFEDMKKYRKTSYARGTKSWRKPDRLFSSLKGVRAKLNYPIMEKLVLALIHVARRLKRYFKAHKITVLTNKPLRILLLKSKKSRRMARWAIILREHEIEYKPRNAIKAQVLADFLAETQEEDEETDFQNEEGKTKNTG
ncbi:reverse transcriptase domain-containing protein [Tanacetum coccineum]|uniref:Reverse transcriptase domain-containing protein n=1 Tax=Tanacetum coccineum TaxID=301880 RepID=A0ABQ5J0V1_9ASTR